MEVADDATEFAQAIAVIANEFFRILRSNLSYFLLAFPLAGDYIWNHMGRLTHNILNV